MSDLVFSVTGTNENPTKFVAKARNFTLTIDEPDTFGGTDQGANPVEFLLAAYAGCLNVMAHIVAREMRFKLNKLEIKVEGTLNPAKVLGQASPDRAGYKEIRVSLFPDADVDQSTLDTWFESVEARCPVNDNLSHTTPITVNIVKKQG